MTDKEPRAAKVQPDDVPVGLMFTLLGALTAIVLVVLIIVWQFFGAKSDANLERTLAKADQVLKRVTKQQQQLLASHAVVDAKKGIYRMPVQRAMELLLANPKLLAPLPKPEPAVVPAAGKGQATPPADPKGEPNAAPKAAPQAAPPKAAPQVAPKAGVPKAAPEASVPKAAPKTTAAKAAPKASVPKAAPKTTAAKAAPKADK